MKIRIRNKKGPKEEKTYIHQPRGMVYDEKDNPIGLSEQYMLKRTVTPYKSKKDIRKYTTAPSSPRDVNFISNYAGSGVIGDPVKVNEKSATKYPTEVPFEGEKHWNIDRFVIEPVGFSSNTMPKVSDIKQAKKSVLADMQKYYMLQGQDRSDAFKSAKKFVKKEVNPRINSAYFKETYGENARLHRVHNQPITNFADENPFIGLKLQNEYIKKFKNNLGINEKEYSKNPMTKKDMEKVSLSYLTEFKKMPKKEAKQKIRVWIKEADKTGKFWENQKSDVQILSGFEGG